MIEFSKFRNNVDIVPYTIIEYIGRVDKMHRIVELV